MNKRIEVTKPEGLDLLRKPFPAHQISKLCKPYSKDSAKGKCKICGGFHGLPAVALDYVGHAALTDRLLEADPMWNWEPFSVGQDGYPVIDGNGGMWIKLTVCGVTRMGYGDAQGKTGGNAMKERIGDALRNAAMRFGAALDLWHKGELHQDEPDEAATLAIKASEVGVTPTAGAGESLKAEERRAIERDAEGIQVHFDAGMDIHQIIEAMEEMNLDTDRKVYFWSLLDSKCRSAIKKAKETAKAEQKLEQVALESKYQ
jgi:hypothetical protein